MKIKFFWFCLGAYSGLLFYIFFLAKRRPRPTLLTFKGLVNLVPFKDKYWFLANQFWLPKHVVVELYKDIFGNILLFMPVPFFLMYLGNIWSRKTILLISAAISIFVELTQFLLSIGVADIDDLLLNCLGAALGYNFYKRFTIGSTSEIVTTK